MIRWVFPLGRSHKPTVVYTITDLSDLSKVGSWSKVLAAPKIVKIRRMPCSASHLVPS